MSALPEHPESIHPALWRATQLARAYGRTVDTGYQALSAQLPGAGWPVGTMIELLLQQAGIGEMRLLSPAFAAVAQKRSIALVAPQQTPHALGYAYTGVHPSRLMWLTTPKSSDALWSTEQILRTGSCGALVLWQQHNPLGVVAKAAARRSELRDAICGRAAARVRARRVAGTASFDGSACGRRGGH
jgi:hypothetical protein